MANVIKKENQGRDVARSSSPASSLWDPFRLMRGMFGFDPFREAESMLPYAPFVPTFDFKETKDAYVFRADMPGIKQEDLEISMIGNRLTISGHRKAERREQGDTFYTTERTYGSFSRSFTLPEGTDSPKIAADLKDGVLEVTVPKRPEVQAKRITIGGKGRGGGGRARGD